jgi:hypothetical protein
MHTDTKLALGTIGGLDAHDLAGAALFRGGLAGDFLGHLQENFDNFALAETGVRGEKNATLRKIHGLGSFFRKPGLPNADTKSGLHIVALGETAIAGENSRESIHQKPPGTKEGAGAM